MLNRSKEGHTFPTVPHANGFCSVTPSSTAGTPPVAGLQGTELSILAAAKPLVQPHCTRHTYPPPQDRFSNLRGTLDELARLISLASNHHKELSQNTMDVGWLLHLRANPRSWRGVDLYPLSEWLVTDNPPTAPPINPTILLTSS